MHGKHVVWQILSMFKVLSIIIISKAVSFQEVLWAVTESRYIFCCQLQTSVESFYLYVTGIKYEMNLDLHT